MLSSLSTKIPIKPFMVGFLGFILAYASIILDTPDHFLRGVFMVGLYALYDLVWTYARDRIWYVPLSSFISGLVLSLVATPSPSWWLVMFMPFCAIVAKQIIHLGKERHIFNPAAFAIVVAFLLFGVEPSWWGVAWIESLTWPHAFLLAGGIFILWRQRRFHVALPFWGIYAVWLLSILKLETFLSYFDPTLFFFMTVMLIEPMTSTFPRYRDRVWYALFVGVFVVGTTWLQTFSFGIVSRADPLIVGLLMGNLLASILFLPKAKVQ